MTLEEAKREFKKHYKKATKLKEGGKAWEREISLASKYMQIGRELYQEEVRAKYWRA